MKFNKMISVNELGDIIRETVKATIEELGLENKPSANRKTEQPTAMSNKSSYQKTEALLYNYRGFQKLVKEKQAEIEDLRKYGVPQKSAGIVQYSPHSGGLPHGLVPNEITVEDAVETVQRSVEGTLQAIAMVDKALESIANDPYYDIIGMIYFDGRTQEDIAMDWECSQVNISKNKSRLVKALSMRLFPNDVAREMMS